jgi:uncharacterized protein (TIGR03067 family)
MMYRSLPLLATLGLLLIPALVHADAKDDAKNELKKFAGTWKVVSAEKDGEKMPVEQAGKVRFVFDGEKMTFKESPSSAGVTSAIKIDVSKKPATLDIAPPEGTDAKGSLCIYKFEDGKLIICMGMNHTRPTEFKSGEKIGLMVLEKEKK